MKRLTVKKANLLLAGVGLASLALGSGPTFAQSVILEGTDCGGVIADEAGNDTCTDPDAADNRGSIIANQTGTGADGAQIVADNVNFIDGVVLGTNAGFNTTAGISGEVQSAVILGHGAGRESFLNHSGVIIGDDAGSFSDIRATGTVVIGELAGNNATINRGTFVGREAGRFGNMTSVTAIGSAAGRGVQAGNTVIIGSGAADHVNPATQPIISGSVVIGDNANRTNLTGGVGYNNVVAVGFQAVSVGNSSVAVGAFSNDAGEANVFAIGAGAGAALGPETRRITNQSRGIADTDGVNVSQLEDLAGALGGGAEFSDTDGSFVGPVYNIDGTDYSDVGSALDALEGLSGGGGGGTGVQYVDQAGAPAPTNAADLTVGANTGGTVANFANAGGVDRTLSGVAVGAVSATSNEAVNGSQLFATDQNVATNAADITNLDNRVTVNEGNITTNTTDIANLDNRVTVNEGNITTNTTDIANLDNRVTVNEGNITTNTTDIANLDNRVTVNEGDITTIDDRVTVLEGAPTFIEQPGGAAGDLLLGGNTGGTVLNITNNAGNNRVITGVAGGNVAAGSTEAINGDQLFTTNQNVTNLDNRVTVLENAAGIAPLVEQPGGADADILVGATTGGTAVDFGNDAGDSRTLTNVAAGNVAAGSTEAVNGEQLFATNQNVADNAQGIADNSSAITNLDNRVTVNEGDIATIDDRVTVLEGAPSFVDQAGGPDGEITIGADTGGTVVNIANDAGENRVITGVEAGELAAGSTDAVNGDQLFATNQNVADNAQGIADNSTAITNLDNRVTVNEGAIADNSTAITNIDDRVTALEGAPVLIAQPNSPDGAIQIGAETGGTEIDLANNAGEARTVSGVADGAIAADSTDAINGAQLFATNEAVADNASAIDGVADGVAANEAAIADNAGAIAEVSAKASQNMMDIAANAQGIADNADAITANHAKIADNAGAIDNLDRVTVQYDTDMNGNPVNSITLGASNGLAGPVTIGNVAAGVADNDAVNVRQLRDAVGEANAYTDQQIAQLQTGVNQRFDALEFDLREVESQAQAGIASVSALTQLRYHDEPGALSIGAAIGGFMGEMSIASGIGYTSENQRVNINAGFGYNPARNEATWGAGATFRID
ncbi:hypothetical protein [Alterisphingorhabdus coralli]|uniref:Trimeric autotransporter adhesin YadA-like stalk domain-containing protein n=1 Tax=Alterisphingorhabdus coralli TaxID=3071408 RepID=A0AA97FAS6_9SPHN|nr:hypothetical protein [Parasphingorhabdus sp. SCSIO 66989]WOE76731.1 hypothetical protein RB602_15205 [Parasphingorhabdus sp. SCSIO 66989]